MAGSRNDAPNHAARSGAEDRFPEIYSELQEPEYPLEEKPSALELVTSRSRGAIATRMTLVAVVAALCMQYYYYDVMREILTLPRLVVNVPGYAPLESASARPVLG